MLELTFAQNDLSARWLPECRIYTLVNNILIIQRATRDYEIVPIIYSVPQCVTACGLRASVRNYFCNAATHARSAIAFPHALNHHDRSRITLGHFFFPISRRSGCHPDGFDNGRMFYARRCPKTASWRAISQFFIDEKIPMQSLVINKIKEWKNRYIVRGYFSRTLINNYSHPIIHLPMIFFIIQRGNTWRYLRHKKRQINIFINK